MMERIEQSEDTMCAHLVVSWRALRVSAGQTVPGRWLGAAVLGLMLTVNAVAAESGDAFTRYAGFGLGQHTLAMVLSRLGPAVPVQGGDASAYRRSLCYSVPGGHVAFLSGELGGDEGTLSAFRLSALPPARSCGAWPRAIAVPGLALNGLSVGMTRPAFEAAMGSRLPGRGNTARVQFVSEGHRGTTVTDILVTVEAAFHHGRLQTLEVWHAETN